jgi:serine/threonine protein phosphatase 1
MIVIGDVHGCFNTLKALMDKLPHRNVIFTGDLIDRGPRSYEVVQFVKDNGFHCVLGNHEEMSLGVYFDFSMWMKNGGGETLDSYKKNEASIVEDSDFFRSLPLFYEIGDKFVVSHSYIGHVFDNQKDFNFKKTAIWGRSFPKPCAEFGGRINIIGHTPIKIRTLEDYPQIIFVDSGCFYKKEGFGYLTAFDTDTEIFYTQENID